MMKRDETNPFAPSADKNEARAFLSERAISILLVAPVPIATYIFGKLSGYSMASFLADKLIPISLLWAMLSLPIGYLLVLCGRMRSKYLLTLIAVQLVFFGFGIITILSENE